MNSFTVVGLGASFFWLFSGLFGAVYAEGGVHHEMLVAEGHEILGPNYHLTEEIRGDTQILMDTAAYRPEVDRRDWLASLYEKLTKGLKDEEAQVLAVLKHVQARMVPPLWAPLDQHSRQMILDPLALYDLRLAGCGQTNRLLVDVLEAGGFKAYPLQLNGHVAAAVWLDGDWRYLDADTQSFGFVMRGANGKIVTVAELHENPDISRNVPMMVEVVQFRAVRGLQPVTDIDTFGSLRIFDRHTYEQYGQTPFLWVRNEGEESFTRKRSDYGWGFNVPMRLPSFDLGG